MNSLRNSFALRVATIIVAISAWLVLSNHCALAELAARHATPGESGEHSCCNPRQGPAKEEAPCPQMPQGCCKTLKVAMPGDVKIPNASVVAAPLFATTWVDTSLFALPKVDARLPDLGPPPDVPGFAELVLNRSLQSHAPPVLA